MAQFGFIPPSKYTTGFTSVEEFYYFDKIGNNINYSGPYFIVTPNKYYAGETPSDPNVFKIFPIVKKQLTAKPLPPEENEDNTSPSQIVPIKTTPNKTLSSPRSLPQPYLPYLTPQQLQQKSFTRYFVKRNNQNLYMEIDAQTFSLNENFAYDLYDKISIEWMIKGDKFNVDKFNKSQVLTVEKPISKFNQQQRYWVGFSQYFKNNFLQFYQNTIEENLYTSGNEYKTKDGREYIGPYHIHPDKGPMVGANHISIPHDYLYKIDSNISQNITGSNTPQNDISTFQPTQTYTPPPPPSGGGSSGGGGY